MGINSSVSPPRFQRPPWHHSRVTRRGTIEGLDATCDSTNKNLPHCLPRHSWRRGWLEWWRISARRSRRHRLHWGLHQEKQWWGNLTNSTYDSVFTIKSCASEQSSLAQQCITPPRTYCPCLGHAVVSDTWQAGNIRQRPLHAKNPLRRAGKGGPTVTSTVPVA